MDVWVGCPEGELALRFAANWAPTFLRAELRLSAGRSRGRE